MPQCTWKWCENSGQRAGTWRFGKCGSGCGVPDVMLYDLGIFTDRFHQNYIRPWLRTRRRSMEEPKMKLRSYSLVTWTTLRNSSTISTRNFLVTLVPSKIATRPFSIPAWLQGCGKRTSGMYEGSHLAHTFINSFRSSSAVRTHVCNEISQCYVVNIHVFEAAIQGWNRSPRHRTSLALVPSSLLESNHWYGFWAPYKRRRYSPTLNTSQAAPWKKVKYLWENCGCFGERLD